MKYQANEIAADSIENTDILYLKTQEGVGPASFRSEWPLNVNTGQAKTCFMGDVADCR